MATGKTTLAPRTATSKIAPRANLQLTEVSSITSGPDLLETLATAAKQLDQMPVREKIELARRISTQLELHTDVFPRPPVLYGALQGIADELESRANDAQIGLGHWRMLASFEARQEALVDKALTQVAHYLQQLSTGGEPIVDVSGTVAVPLEWTAAKIEAVEVSKSGAAKAGRGGSGARVYREKIS